MNIINDHKTEMIEEKKIDEKKEAI